MQCLNISIYGRVQGVYFRKTIQKYARELGIRGYVENKEDGSVFIQAYGKEHKIKTFLKMCKKGSPLSHTKEITITKNDLKAEILQEFIIKKNHSFLKDQINSFLNLKKNIMEKEKTERKIPQHIVIIPNGNRTWSRKNKFTVWEGYWQAYRNLSKTYKEILKIGIPHLTLWGLSTENWKRDQREINEVFKVIEKILTEFNKKLGKEEVGFHHFGRKDRLPENISKLIEKLEEKTKGFTKKSFNIALDYGGRDEILRAINSIINSGKKNINEQDFSNELDTRDVPDPDLIIRTAGEKRLSGMMPWQSTYAEYYFTDLYFPEFDVKAFKDAIDDFSKRKRTFGGDVDMNAKQK